MEFSCFLTMKMLKRRGKYPRFYLKNSNYTGVVGVEWTNPHLQQEERRIRVNSIIFY